MSSGTATVMLLVPIIVWAVVLQLWLVSFCYRKRKPVLARIGLVALIVPGLFIVPLVGAIRLARPSSSWAVLHYGDEFMGRAARRYPDDHEVAMGFSLPREQRTLWEKLLVAGTIVTALFLILVFAGTEYSGPASIIMLTQVTAVAGLAEVELTAKPYLGRSVPASLPASDSVRALR